MLATNRKLLEIKNDKIIWYFFNIVKIYKGNSGLKFKKLNEHYKFDSIGANQWMEQLYHVAAFAYMSTF